MYVPSTIHASSTAAQATSLTVSEVLVLVVFFGLIAVLIDTWLSQDNRLKGTKSLEDAD